ncbi:MAG: lipid asymmetry maintenance protein MlaB [Gammaproteobacteria bacterium]
MSTAPDAIVLDGTCRIAGVAALKEACDASASDLTIDASGVESVDAAALQCLLAVRRQCDAMNRGFKLVSPSAAFVSAARTIGLEETFGLGARE